MRRITAGVLNAAVGFDEQTLAPTYELRMGVPGASAGINIAQQLGLNRRIIAEARAAADLAGAGRRALSRPLALRPARDLTTSERSFAVASRSSRASATGWQPRARKSSRTNFARWRRSWRVCCATSSTTRGRAVNAVQDRARRRRSCRKMPSAALPRCVASSANSSTQPSSRTPPVRIEATSRAQPHVVQQVRRAIPCS